MGWALVAGVMLGLVLNLALGGSAGPTGLRIAAALIDYVLRPVGGIFMNLLFMMVVPLIFSSLALGVAALREIGNVGRLGARVLLGTLVLTAAGVAIGLVCVNTIRPGAGLPAATVAALRSTASGTGEATTLAKVDAAAKASRPFHEQVVASVSRNPLEDAVNLFSPNPNYRGGGILAFLLACALFGAAVAALPDAGQRHVMTTFLEGLQSVCMAVIGWALGLAPFGVAALIAVTVASTGPATLAPLAKYMGTVLLALALQLALTYPAVLRWTGYPVRLFFRRTRVLLITAFSTSSSNATLPTSLRTAEHELELPSPVSRFVLTLGATVNQNGTALFEGVTLLFLAQLYQVELAWQQQVLIIVMSMIAGIGTAGVPGGSLPLIALLLPDLGIPTAAIGIVMGVDRLLDMSRTVVNVLGDMVLTIFVAKGHNAAGSAHT